MAGGEPLKKIIASDLCLNPKQKKRGSPTVSEENIINESAENLSEIMKVRREKLEDLIQNKTDPFLKTKFIRDAYSSDIKDKFEEMDGKTVCLAGRIMSRRDMGKASFCDLQDDRGRIQLYVRQDALGEEAYASFKKYDIGDIVGLTGMVFRTHKGEISVRCQMIDLLSKSLRPLPEKFHGLKDPDLRYRQRYVDLIMNPEVRRTFEIRTKVIKGIRARWFERPRAGVLSRGPAIAAPPRALGYGGGQFLARARFGEPHRIFSR
jgi:lysyl-tRNA synthetase class 2